MSKLITICWFGFSHNFGTNRYMSKRSFIREHPFTMRALNIWIVWASCNQITMIIVSTFIIVIVSTNLISTLIPLVNFGTFFSRIKMYTLFPLHHSTHLIFLSQIRLLPLHSVPRNHSFFRLFNCSMLLIVSKCLLFSKLASWLLSHHGSLVRTKFFIETTTAINLLGCRPGRWTTLRSPLMWLLVSQLGRGLWFVDNVFTFRDMAFSGN